MPPILTQIRCFIKTSFCNSNKNTLIKRVTFLMPRYVQHLSLNVTLPSHAIVLLPTNVRYGSAHPVDTGASLVVPPPCAGPASRSPSSALPVATPILPPVHHDAARMASSLASSPCRTEPCIRFLSISSQIAPSRLLPTIIFSLSIRREKTPHAVALRFTRRDQLETGLTPAGVPPHAGRTTQKASTKPAPSE